MVTLIAIGIEKYQKDSKSSFCDIPCAYQDAKRVYESFEKVLEHDMKRYASACIKNCTALECKVLLSALELSVERDDILVFYFSGHGFTESNGKLKLVFTDYGYLEKKGVIALEEIVSILKEYECKIVLILDCCYSGAGLSECGKDDPMIEQNISILTSNGSIGRAEYTEQSGSVFTKHLCDALLELHDLQKEISLDNIYKCISVKYNKCKIITGGGKADICLQGEKNNKFPEDFAIKFVDKVLETNYEMREALWYSVGDFPVGIQLKVLETYRNTTEDAFAEMSWRVRRAIGSICASCKTEGMDVQIKKLIQADNWMEKCIGYIGLSKRKDAWIKEVMQGELKKEKPGHPMDFIWLIILYLSEHEDVDTDLILQSNLMKTAWGAMEVWKRYFIDKSVEEKLQLFEQNVDAEVYRQLCLELYLRGKISTIKIETYPDLVQNHIEEWKDLYQGKVRGRIPKSRVNKWIFSILYGNWRDQVNLNEILKKMMKTKRKDDKSSFLKSLKYIPSVEVKMAILDYYITDIKVKKAKTTHHNNLLEDLKWALSDEHPWVVRTALPLFKDNKEWVQEFIEKNPDMQIYPGVFDLDIELSRQGLENVDYEIRNMTELEEKKLQWTKEREK